MPKDAPPNGGATLERPGLGSFQRVSGMQTKLHCWAAADPGRRFDDLFNLVCDPATLLMAFVRVAGNRGAMTAGVDGWTVATVTGDLGVQGFLDDLRTQLKTGTFWPLPVRQRMIPKPGGSGKLRKLGIPTIADRVVQAALKLVLEPIFEADFLPVSYGFRPQRRAHDAMADIHRLGTQGYHWVLDADIEACFDMIDHTVLLDRVRIRVKDKRIVALVKAFLKAGIMTETGHLEESDTGTPQGGILSPLLANIALSVLDEHVMAPWQPDAEMGTTYRRHRRRQLGLPTWRIVRYADDFVVLVHGSRADVETLHEDVTHVLQPLGLRLSAAKTRIVHMSDGFDFLGFHIRWKRKRGTNKWYVYTFIAQRPVRSVKAKVRSLTHRVSQANMGAVITRINQILRGWTNYFRHAVSVCNAHLESTPLLRELAGDQVALQATPLEVESVPPPIHHPQRGMAPLRSRRSDLDQSGLGDGESLPIPGREDSQPLPAKETSEQLTVESRVRREAHARFGERPGETDRQ